MALETGGTPVDIAAPIYSDWLIGDPSGDVLSEQAPVRENYGSDEAYNTALAEYNNRLEASIEGFKDMYGGYTHDQVATAIMYDMRRVPTSKDNNPNYTARTFQELDRNAFLSHQNYEIVRHLYENGWLQLYKPTVNFYLGSRRDKNNEVIGDTVRYWCFPIEGTAKTNIDGQEYTLKDCNEPHRVMVSITGSNYYYNIAPIALADKTPQQRVQLPTLKVLEGSTSITFPVTELGERMGTAGQDNQTITLNLEDATYINLETGEIYPTTPKLEAGNEYTIRLTLLDGEFEFPGNNENNTCRVGYVFLNLQILPSTLVWSPSGESFNGWGKDENWKGWTDKNSNYKIDEGELIDGFVPIKGVDVLISQLNNTLLYPYIVPEHTHNHYPLTINFQPHHCDDIYFAPGAHIYNQHLLDYEKAFVDMQFAAAKWHLVSAPLQGMVSGDMFVPHNGWWSSGSNNLIAEPDPFKVSGFQGIRHGDAAYAFWEAFYNTSVDGSNTLIKEFNNIQFTQSNTLAQELKAGHGYAVYGLGWKDTEMLTVRLPKPDQSYAYFADGKEDGTTVQIPNIESRGKLAYTDDHTQKGMTINLTNKTSSDYFLFGNPTMAFVDMHALYLDNQSQWSGEFKTMTSDIINATTPSTMTTANRYLPPMTSALLKVPNAATEMTITLLPSHLTLNTTVNPADAKNVEQQGPQPAPARRIAAIEERPINYEALQSELLTIYAFTSKGTSRTVLATNPAANDYYTTGEDALFTSTGVENESYVTSPLNMYTVAEQVPMMADVRQGISEIPLGILVANGYRTTHMQVAFYLSANWSRECYFCDSKTGQKIRIMDGLVISVEMPQNHEQRYYIEGPDQYLGSGDGGVSTSTSNISTSDQSTLKAYSMNEGEMIVSASGLMREIMLYDMLGRQIANKKLHLLSNHTTIATGAGLYIVEATMQDGTKVQTQAFVK